METKPIVSVTYENERISIKKQLTLLKMCVTSLLCGPRADLRPFYGFLCKWFSLYIKLRFTKVGHSRLQRFATFDSLPVQRRLEAR